MKPMVSHLEFRERSDFYCELKIEVLLDFGMDPKQSADRIEFRTALVNFIESYEPTGEA